MQGQEGALGQQHHIFCKSTNRATVKLDAQNGRAYDTKPVVTNPCGAKAKKKGKRHR
jgi:hypothetical protein